MNLTIQAIATIAKSVSIKREKGANESEAERVVAHLKFAGLFLKCEELDELCGFPVGWFAQNLFLETGEPVAHWVIEMPLLMASVSGSIVDSDNDHIRLTNAALTDVSVTLTSYGGRMDGHLSWEVAGDEASDLEPLLGQKCAVEWVITGPAQSDWVDDARKDAA